MVYLKRHLAFTLIYLLIAILQITGLYYNITGLITYTKPLIVIWLAIFLIISTSLKGRFHKRILTGLVFSIIGDLIPLLGNSNEDYFSYSLLAFLLCHLFYIRAFYLDFKSAPELDKAGARVAIISCAILSTVFFFVLRPYLGSMRVPILAYILMISFMFMMAAFRNLRVNKASFYLVLVGAACFMFSDALLSYNRFVFNFSGSHFLILITYMVAQYLIVLGSVERQLLHRN
jgi:uncharacterized membrane protein YhhN